MTSTIVRVAALGIGLGAFAAVGDRLPIDAPTIVLVALANAVSPWVVVAFFAGSRGRAPSGGAVLGIGTLVLAVVAYYVIGTAVLAASFVDPVRASAAWAVVAVVVGGPVGAGGAAWATGMGRARIAGVSLLAGLLLAEAVARYVEVEGWTGYDLARTALQVAAVDAIVAVLAVWLLAGRARLAVAVGSVAVGLAAAIVLLVAIPLIRGAATG